MSSISDAIAHWRRRNGFAPVPPRAALVDMDGTLYDSMRLHSAAWEQLASEMGWSYSQGEFFMLEGATGAYIVNLMMERHEGRKASQREIEQLYARKASLFRSMSPARPMPGALELMEELKSRGIKRVLVTGSGQNSLIDRLNDDFPGIFADDMRITARDVSRCKPHPEPFLKGMAVARTLPCESIVIENAPLGAKAGRASQAFTLAADTGPLPIESLADADIAFPSMTALAAAAPAILSALRS